VAGRSERGSRSAGYFLRFGFTALVLGGLTLILVLVVLPRRFILNAGLREADWSFPSEAPPFAPPEEIVLAPPPLPSPPPEPVRGPAEIFWSEVQPLLRSGRFSRALPLFEAYLAEYPEDRGVLKEYAITLQKAGSPGEAVLVFDRLLSAENDPAVRLLLARALRDRGRMEEASVQYRVLHDESPSDASLALEWGQALAWTKDYGGAAEVLSRGLAADSSSVDLRIALSQVYYWSGQLDAADEVLAILDDETLRTSGGLPLKREILAALTPAEPPPAGAADTALPLTTWEKIAAARAEEDYGSAAALFQEILRETPGDTTAWRAYADVLQFGLEDLEGARSALLSLAALAPDDPALQFRLGQLEIWTGRNQEASRRLETLLAALRNAPVQEAPQGRRPFASAEIAEVTALLGDLRRWSGERALSGDTYRMALQEDPANVRALEGLAEVETEAADDIENLEEPGVGGNAYSLTDSDDFTRLDLGVAGKTIQEHWVWGFRTGTRWLGGFDLSSTKETDQGLFLELESARWWRWGTLRTGLHLALEENPSGSTDLAFGASVHLGDLAGFRTDLRYDHGPAYPITMTLQSVYNGVTQDRITANLSRGLGRRWSVSLAGDAAWLQPGAAGGRTPEGSLRLEAGGSLGRFMTDHLVLGLNARALSYSRPSPVVDDLRLFWDPDGLVSGGVYAQWDRDLAASLNFRARVNPSLAFIDERVSSGFELVPHVSAEAGLSHGGSRIRTTLEGFYYQGRFDGYKAYGVRLSFTARDWFRKEEDR